MWMIRDVVEIILLVVREIYRLFTSYQDFAELEKGIYRLAQEITLRLFVIGCIHAGRRKSQKLRVKADEVWVAARDSRRGHRKLAIKVSVGYVRKDGYGAASAEPGGTPGSCRCGRCAGVLGANSGTIWTALGPSAIGECYVGGDGAP